MTVVSVTRPGPGPNTPEEVSPELAVMTESTSEGASGVVMLSEVLFEAVEEEEVVDVGLCVDDEDEDNTSENGLMMLPDVVGTVEDEEVELELLGRSPPLSGVSVTTPVTVELEELVDSARAGTDVEVVKVDDVAAAVLAAAEVPLEVTVVVVEPVVPRPPPGVSVDPRTTLTLWGFTPRPAVNDAAAPGVTETAKSSTAMMEGPAGMQFSIPGYCAL